MDHAPLKTDRYKSIRLSLSDGVATISLNNPEKLNPLSKQLRAEMLDILTHIENGQLDARALLIRGEGRGFCSGADLTESGTGPLGDRLREEYHPFLDKLINLPIPTICAVGGIAAGAGLSLALSTDITIASHSASFLMAFVRIGLAPDAGATWLVPRLIGPARARAMMMLGEPIPAQQAQEWGLIFDCVPDNRLEETALKLAQNLAKGPTQSYLQTRVLVNDSFGHNYDEQLEKEAEIQSKLGESQDFVEGVTAFLEKRAAKFKGT